MANNQTSQNNTNHKDTSQLSSNVNKSCSKSSKSKVRGTGTKMSDFLSKNTRSQNDNDNSKGSKSYDKMTPNEIAQQIKNELYEKLNQYPKRGKDGSIEEDSEVKLRKTIKNLTICTDDLVEEAKELQMLEKPIAKHPKNSQKSAKLPKSYNKLM